MRWLPCTPPRTPPCSQTEPGRWSGWPSPATSQVSDVMAGKHCSVTSRENYLISSNNNVDKKKNQKIIDPMETIKSHIQTVSLTIFQSYTLPILHPSNHTLFQLYILSILHFSNLTPLQSYNLAILHSSNLTLF